MAQYHSHDTHDTHGSTVVAEDSGSPSVFLAVIAIVLIGFLIWLFAFSGVVFDRNDSTTVVPRDTNVETNNFDQDQAPPANDAPQQQPAPGTS